ncbi:hypothetical protein NA57DRAFT_51752 [Rhizodiscina lignyota]|uniref:Tail specific protease domain-containing protein n=1 Tax=Rhizodiscina lignyota TaxID=1504668 RepID=A0A9P4IRT7_9PEZI|nr:hypothetical protein NA57DRAFT_51752 [Rhizodiscina lignyota]
MIFHIFLLFLTAITALSIPMRNPCDTLFQANKAQIKASSSAQPSFKPSEVTACLKDVPINTTLATALIEYLETNLQFQSTLAYLKSPPQSYPHPPLDLFGGLAAIKQNVQANAYENEYDFEKDIHVLVAHAFDGHLAVDASPLVQIDGVNVEEYILSFPAVLQDPDAQYNDAFYTPTNALTLVGAGSFTSQFFVFPEDSTKYTFKNGTTTTVLNTATPLTTIDYQSGQDLFEKYLIPSNTAPSSNSTATATASTPNPTKAAAELAALIREEGYPSPLVASLDTSISGYFLPNVPDTAILSITGFAASSKSTSNTTQRSASSFQNAAQELFTKARASGKTRLIIDMRGNLGGTADLAFGIFKQLFPQEKVISPRRFRIHPLADALGQVNSALGSVDSSEPSGPNFFLDQAAPFNFEDYVNSPSGKPFNSWSELSGPVTVHGDNFSRMLLQKISDPAFDLATGGVVLSGFANEAKLPPQPFAPSNITIITDGRCSSTCGVFTNLLLDQGVAAITFGGRPEDKPMAVIGGTQGAIDLDVLNIQQLAKLFLEMVANEKSREKFHLSATLEAPLRRLAQPSPLNLGSSGFSLNFMDHIGKDDETMTPLQFAPPITANCRVWYMPQDIANVTNTWERVASGKYTCVGQKATSTQTPRAAPPLFAHGVIDIAA